MVAAGAARAVQLADDLGEPLEGGGVVEGAGHEAQTAAQLLEDALLEAGAGVLGHGLLDVVGEVVVGPVATAVADEAEARREQPAVGEVVDRRQQLLAGEVAGDAEHHHGAGPGDQGQATVARIPQRVRRAGRGGGGGGVGHDGPFSDTGRREHGSAAADPCSGGRIRRARPRRTRRPSPAARSRPSRTSRRPRARGRRRRRRGRPRPRRCARARPRRWSRSRPTAGP